MQLSRTPLLQKLGFVALLGLSGLAVPGCISPPDYSDTPEIEFRSITIAPVVINETPFDKIDIVIGYRDGDGDLGLDGNNFEPPYNPKLPDGSPNPTTNNYFCQLQVRQTDGSFRDVNPPADILDGRYPNLTPASQGDRAAPLRGDISYRLLFPPNVVTPPGTVIRFRVSILDRALHRSNPVVTAPVTIPR